MKILVAEDSKYYRILLEDNLKQWGYDPVPADNGAEAWEILQLEDGPRLALLDWIMPQMNGLQVCQKIRSREKESYIYVILLTSQSGKENVIAGLESGADDYIIKPFNEEELKYRLKIGERILRLENRIMQLASIDPLTGVLNRRVFMERLDSEIQRYYRFRTPLSVIMMDLDYFKNVNDLYGHLAGDQVLRQVAEKLGHLIRGYDFIGRYGGEEFIICLPAAGSERISDIAERIRIEIEKMHIPLEGNINGVKITASFGVSCLEKNTGVSIDELIKKADNALYQSKREGRNRVCIAPSL